MEVNLQSVESLDLPDRQRAMFDILKATLQYPANSEAKSVKIAEAIDSFCNSLRNGAHVGETLWQVWTLVIEIACCIPPSHLWQDSLIKALDNLRHRDGPICRDYKMTDQPLLWNDLPNLSYRMREKWNDPTCFGEGLSQEIDQWKNLNSFAARLTNTGFAPWLNLPIWQLRVALEEPLLKGPEMECRLWVASEWIIYGATPLFKYMSLKEELDESSARALGTGSLCEGIPPLSLERWKFWKKRFSEMVDDASSLGLGSAITGRLSNALKTMGAVEE